MPESLLLNCSNLFMAHPYKSIDTSLILNFGDFQQENTLINKIITFHLIILICLRFQKAFNEEISVDAIAWNVFCNI